MRDSYKKGAKGNKKRRTKKLDCIGYKTEGEELGLIAIKKENLDKGVLL